jgi:hypothetical protein
MDVHRVISEVSLPVRGDIKERFSPVTARELISFMLSKLQTVASRGAIVVVTPVLLRGQEGYFLPVIGPCENINFPTRSVGIVPGRMAIPPGTTYLVRNGV